MTWTPQLNVICGRCGKRREGIRHDCRQQHPQGHGQAEGLAGEVQGVRQADGGNPLAHVCAPKSDFKKRKHGGESREGRRRRKQQDRHDYQACSDRECPRPLCVAYKTGWKTG